MQKIHEIRASVYREKPLIHLITNPISINQCANGVLAVGARPIMAEHPAEVGEITETADALVLSLGNITDVRIPVVLDAVGIACSKLRLGFLEELFEKGVPVVIKGNYSEIYALRHTFFRSSGVDADGSISVQAACEAACELARKFHAVILVSGKTDIVTDGTQIVKVANGTPQLSSVTGTGCLLGALCGAYLTVCSGMDAAVAACAVLGICGQIAETPKGSGSFLMNLMDALSTLTDTKLDQYIHLEAAQYEKA